MAYERLSDSLFEKYTKNEDGKSKVKAKSSKKKKDLPVMAEYTQLPRDSAKPAKKKKSSENEKEEGFPETILVRIAGMTYRFTVDSSEEKAKTLYTAKIANDLLAETLEENPLIPTNQALILAYMEACLRWQTELHRAREEKPKELPLLPLEQYCKENNIPKEVL